MFLFISLRHNRNAAEHISSDWVKEDIININNKSDNIKLCIIFVNIVL
jgi:hypothetical protein